MALESSTDLEALERFVAENDELQELEEKIGRFNVFDALGIARAEIRHSNFLAWLLDPNESHGQGDLFLKAVLMDMLRRAREQGVKTPFSPVVLDGTEMGGVEIRREWKNIDILICCQKPRFIIAIENKVDSGEHSNQLSRYSSSVESGFRDFPRMFVFLSPDRLTASAQGWMAYSYAEMHRVFARVRKQSKGAIGTDVAVFLDHYLNLIGSRFMEDRDIPELCRKIYANHRRAIDLIKEHAESPKHEVLEPIRDWLTKQEDLLTPSSPRNLLYAVPRSWAGSLCNADGSASQKSPCSLFIEVESWGGDKSSISIRLVAGPGKDRERRESAIKLISETFPNLKMQRKTVSTTWTRLGSKTLMHWNREESFDADAAVRAVEDYIDSISDAIKNLPTLLKDFVG